MAALVSLIALSGCSDSNWAEISRASATGPGSTDLTLELTYCDAARNPSPVESLEESATEVRVRLSIPIPSADRDDCMGVAEAALDSPIGDRTVVDDRTGERYTVHFNDTNPPTTTTASAPLHGTRYATLTDRAWVLREAIDPRADSPFAVNERPPMEWYAEYLDGLVMVRLSGHAATFPDTVAALEQDGFAFGDVRLERWNAVGGSAPNDPSSPTIILLDNGPTSLALLSYELNLDRMTALADTVIAVGQAAWTSLGGIIE